ncbi:hypothetical protein [Paenibacillus sacheonensis]|uniref:Uncharacterized protein n=1 Tax=Paenibacillus sacheonensis TaxID=742054 RepID=A0A7X5BX79_9BACL|nr:hypothetical protein [Paenibacillus sacheonensis]MBM7565042.1 hypothetical protein [Paenibacillus sacheonensis]NBC70173.1 hypothetical protein [Paenibacillus sacheonensis]
MFGLFKRKRRSASDMPSRVHISIDKQLEHLEAVGIRLKPDVEIEQCSSIMDAASGAREGLPFIHLLMTMGRELDGEEGCEGIFLSNDAWCFDRECIEDHGDYVLKLERIAMMLAPEIVLANLQDYVDMETGECWISFCANGTYCRHELTLSDDWLSLEFFAIFSELLAASGSPKRFFYSDTGNELAVVLIDKDCFGPLSERIPIFLPTIQA